MSEPDLTSNCYVPYSHHPEAAWVESEQGRWFPGVRIENISFPLTIAAPQAAIYSCLSEGQCPRRLFAGDQAAVDSPSMQYWRRAYQLQLAPYASAEPGFAFEVLQPLQADQVHERLLQLLNHSQAGYSDFPVAALLETGTGFVSGINIETEDWGKGLCAERVALAKALAAGIADFRSLHVATRSGEYSSPCGACRQVILEHLPHQPVYLHHADGSRAVHYSSDLLPYSFQSSALQNSDS